MDLANVQTKEMRNLDLSLEVSSHYSNDLKIIEDIESDRSGKASFDSPSQGLK